MSLLRPAPLALACLGLVLAAPARTAPLGIQDLLDFHHSGLTTEAVRELVTREGLAAPVGADAVRELQAAGMPSDLVSWLITSGTAATSAVEGVDYDIEEGVLVVSGEGEATVQELWPSEEPPLEMEVPASGGSGQTIILNVAPAQPATEVLPSYYPGWGWPMVAQVPARFGDPTSAFGTTIVSVGGVAGGFVAPLGSGLGTRDACTVPVHTSRGTLYLPN